MSGWRVNWIGGGDGSDAEGERLAGGKGLGGVHDSRLCDGGHILATCVSGVLEAGGILWRDGRHREVCLFRRAVWNDIFLAGVVGVDGLKGGLFIVGRGCVLQVSVDVLGLLVREFLCWGRLSSVRTKGSDGAVAR